MDLSRYQTTAEIGERGIQFLRNKETGHALVLKRCEFQKGMKEIRAYRCMERSALIDFSIEPQGVLLLMHRHHGLSLAEILESDRLIDHLIDHFDRFLFSALQSVRHLHHEGVIHGRITPSKLIVDDDYGVKIVGFGEAGDSGSRVEIEDPDRYTAPEIVFGVVEDPRLADYYSLGQCLRTVVRGREDRISFDSLEIVAGLSSVLPGNRRASLHTTLDS